MAAITGEMVKQLRDMTGAGLTDCKSALTEAEGSVDKAVEILRKKGMKDLGKRAGKTAAEGTVGVYIHPGDQVVAVVELNCETDFVARGEGFKQLARDIAMQVAAMRPQYVTGEEVPESVLAKEREILMEQLNDEQKKKADKIIPGRLEKFMEQVVLLNQPYVKDDTESKTVKNMVDEYSLKCGEKVQVRRFYRIEVGEGIQKQQANLVEDVAALMQGN